MRNSRAVTLPICTGAQPMKGRSGASSKLASNSRLLELDRTLGQANSFEVARLSSEINLATRGRGINLARVLPPIGIVVGLYLFWAGADHPGGKFQSATILAAMWMLVQMAGLGDTPRTDGGWLRLGLVIGPLVFVAVGAFGIPAAGAFLAYPDTWPKPLILLVEVALLPTLVLVLALLMNGPPRRHGGAR